MSLMGIPGGMGHLCTFENIGTTGLGDFSSDQYTFRTYNRDAREAASRGDYVTGQSLLTQAEAISRGNPAVDPGGTEIAFTRQMMAGDAESRRAYQGGQVNVAAAEENQPSWWDRLVGNAPDLIPVVPGVSAGEAVTWWGGYTSAMGITDPQSGRDLVARKKAEDELKKLTCQNLPGPLAWACEHPAATAGIGLGLLGAFYLGPPLIGRGKAWSRAVLS